MGHVYEATDLRLDRRVAVKVLRAPYGASPELRKRFAREARAVAQIQHEHVVAVFDAGALPSGEPYLVLEYLEGRDLRSLLQEQGTLTAPRAVRLMHESCLGLAAAHARGVIHRDLKPENVFIVSRGKHAELCKVLDFGLAKLRGGDECDLQTRLGVPFGTLHYMSPEQARGEADVDERTDVYSAAAVLYEALSGERPHTADSAHALLYKITHEQPIRLEQRCAHLPPGLADIVHQGLTANLQLRTPSMETFARSLERFMRPMEARPSPPILDAAAAELETLPERLADGRASSDSTARLRRPARTLLVSAGVLGAGLLWLHGHSSSAPRVQAATQGTKAAWTSVLPSAAGAASGTDTESVLARSAESAPPGAISVSSHDQRSRPPTPPPKPSARAVPTRSSPMGDPMGFDRQNPYAESSAFNR